MRGVPLPPLPSSGSATELTVGLKMGATVFLQIFSSDNYGGSEVSNVCYFPPKHNIMTVFLLHLCFPPVTQVVF